MTDEQDPRLERLLFLTDGVYAIALTLLAVELLNLPEEAKNLHGHALLESLLKSWPGVLGFLTSFTVVSIIWAVHHRIFQFVRRFDGRLLWLQLLQLLCIAFIPFPTVVIGEHVTDPVAQQFYYGSLLVLSIISAALWFYVSTGNRLVHPELHQRVIRHYHRIALSAPASFLVMMGLIAAGVGRLINPLLLGYVLAFGYIALGIFEWLEPIAPSPEEARPKSNKDPAT
ncbi:MAG: TMEM175 family protein, partial [Actinomycetota bacterium]|nr:TMEM175 family protein [Actinomycetota bacterium]